MATRNYMVASRLPPPPPGIAGVLRLETQLAPGIRSPGPLDPEEHDVLDVLERAGSLGVVEVARHLGRPAWLTRVLLSDLLDKGLVILASQQPDAPNRALLTRLLGALEKL
jgi:hypothetical protein